MDTPTALTIDDQPRSATASDFEKLNPEQDEFTLPTKQGSNRDQPNAIPLSSRHECPVEFPLARRETPCITNSESTNKPSKDDVIEDESNRGTIDETMVSATNEDGILKQQESNSFTGVELTTTSTHTSGEYASSSVAKIKRNVSFGTLHIREFPVALGDNPSVQFGGPPIRLEYKNQQEEYLFPVHEYEDQRQERRKSAELRVPASLRREWVGRDPKIERQVALHRRQRNHSIAMQDYDDLHYTLERVRRGVAKVFQRKKQPGTNSLADQWNRKYKKRQNPTT